MFMTGLLRRLRHDGTTHFMAGSLLLNLLRIVSTVALTRLLDPRDFGAMGVIASVQFVLIMISDVGFFAYVVRQENPNDRRMLDEIWTLRLIRGIALAAMIALLSGPIAAAIGKPQLALLIAVSGLQLAIEGLSSMAFATGAQRGQIGRLALLDLIPSMAQIALSILLALLLRNYWAMMIAILLATALKAGLSYGLFTGAGRRFTASRARARHLWRFGRYIAGSSVTQIIVSQTDKIVFARLFSLHQFGVYALASNLAATPQTIMANYSPRMLYPRFAAACREGPDRLAASYYAAGRATRLAYMLGAGALIALAPLIVTLLYGARYAGAIPYLELLACAVVFRLPGVIANDLILATGNSVHALRIGLFRAAWLAAAAALLFALAGSWGLVAAVVSVEIATQAYCWFMLRRIGVLRWRQEIRFYAMVPVGYMLGAAVNAAGMTLLS